MLIASSSSVLVISSLTALLPPSLASPSRFLPDVFPRMRSVRREALPRVGIDRRSTATSVPNDGVGDDLGHRGVIAVVEARHGSPVPGIRLDRAEIDRVSGLMTQGVEQGALHASVAFQERMDRIDLVDVLRGAAGELFRLEAPQVGFSIDHGEPLLDLRLDVLGFAEGDRAASCRDGAVLAGPIVDLLEDVPMDRAHASRRDRLISWKRGHARARRQSFGALEIARAAKASLLMRISVPG